MAKIVVGRMGQQKLTITDSTVDPTHAELIEIGKGKYVIKDLDSTRGTFVQTLRVIRKIVDADTPIQLGGFATTADQLVHGVKKVNLYEVWNNYTKEAQTLERNAMIINSARVLVFLGSGSLAAFICSGNEYQTLITVLCTIVFTAICILMTQKYMKHKTQRMQELEVELQNTYQCPHCHTFLGKLPYALIKSKNPYCKNPHCKRQLP